MTTIFLALALLFCPLFLVVFTYAMVLWKRYQLRDEMAKETLKAYAMIQHTGNACFSLSYNIEGETYMVASTISARYNFEKVREFRQRHKLLKKIF